MKRSGPLTRRTPLRRTRRKRRWAPRRSPVTPAVHDDVMARDDHACVGPRVGLPGRCTGRLKLDHIDNEGMARRGPSIPANLICVCHGHHRYKTEHAREVRPLFRERVRSRSTRPPGGW